MNEPFEVIVKEVFKKAEIDYEGIAKKITPHLTQKILEQATKTINSSQFRAHVEDAVFDNVEMSRLIKAIIKEMAGKMAK